MKLASGLSPQSRLPEALAEVTRTRNKLGTARVELRPGSAEHGQQLTAKTQGYLLQARTIQCEMLLCKACIKGGKRRDDRLRQYLAEYSEETLQPPSKSICQALVKELTRLGIDVAKFDPGEAAGSKPKEESIVAVATGGAGAAAAGSSDAHPAGA